MSHHSGDDALLVASSDSFWEPGNYKKTTKRVEDGHRLCNDLMTLLTERGDIERAYAKSLHTWAKKWNDQIEKGWFASLPLPFYFFFLVLQNFDIYLHLVDLFWLEPSKCLWSFFANFSLDF